MNPPPPSPRPKTFGFEKLHVWQGARQLVNEVYALTKDFPRTEVYGLVSQLNRASVSVACNLAEGSARTSAKDQAHFSQVAYSSLMETACLVVICADNRFIDEPRAMELRTKIQALAAGINALRKSQQKTV